MNEPRRGEVWIVDLGFLREGAVDAQSLVTIPHGKLIRKIGTLPATQLAEVERVVAKWLGLESKIRNKLADPPLQPTAEKRGG